MPKPSKTWRDLFRRVGAHPLRWPALAVSSRGCALGPFPHLFDGRSILESAPGLLADGVSDGDDQREQMMCAVRRRPFAGLLFGRLRSRQQRFGLAHDGAK